MACESFHDDDDDEGAEALCWKKKIGKKSRKKIKIKAWREAFVLPEVLHIAYDEKVVT